MLVNETNLLTPLPVNINVFVRWLCNITNLNVSIELEFVTVLLACFGELGVIPRCGVFARVCVTVLGLLWGNFQCPLGQQFTNTIYACAFICACSFTVCSVRASCSVLLSFSVFFPPFSPFIISSNGIVVLISPLNLVQCDGCLGWGWVWRAGLVAELWVGKAFGVFLLPGLGSAAAVPRFLRTQPPCATQALTSLYQNLKRTIEGSIA